MDTSSFFELLRRHSPHLLPAGRSAGDLTVSDALPHGTTIVALKFPGGVLIAGDRRSTQGNIIAGRDVQKIHVTDDYTATGIAGTAAIAVEFARLYAVELEHYEKVEGVALTFAGKVNRLSIMVRGNLGAALQGFVGTATVGGLRPRRSQPRRSRTHRVVRRGRRLERRDSRATSRWARARSSRSRRSRSCTRG